jgi:hypothetical protein
VRRFVLSALLLGALAACTAPTPPRQPKMPSPEMVRPDTAEPRPPTPPSGHAKPAMLRAEQHLQCVPYAREVSGVRIRGDAWTWWNSAKGRYARGARPRVGAVVQLDTGPKRGHLAVVRAVADSRRIIVDHANWLNQGRIHRNTPMVDVSKANDWSRVRVWYTPGDQLGASTYRVQGFIYPEQRTARAE